MESAASAAAAVFTSLFATVFAGGWIIIIPALVAALCRVFGRKIQGHVIDGLVFSLCWWAAVIIAGASPPITFMSEYSVEHFIIYIKTMSVMTLCLYGLSILAFLVLGGSLGKRIAGFTTINEDGSRLPLLKIILRSSILFLFGILILAPGPIVGYLFGNGSEIFSVLLLLSAFGCWYFFAVQETIDQGRAITRTRLERWLGIKTVALFDEPSRL